MVHSAAADVTRMNLFTVLFLAAVALSAAVRLWLAVRHAGHVAAHRTRVPEEFAHRIELPAHQRAADYTCAKVRLGMVHTVVDAAVVLLLTLGGGLSAIDRFWVPIAGTGLLRGLVLIGSVAVVSALVDLPFTLRRIFGIEARFGFNKMTVGMFVSDTVKQSLLAAAIGGPVVLAALWMMERLGDLWWLYAWIAWILFNLAVLAVYPTWIAPLFNKFTPLEQPELKSRIEALLNRCGFSAQGLFVMDGSRRSSHGNAYFTGFGKTKRVVFFDTLLQSLEPPEIEAVLAHELGHFKRRHVVKRIVLVFATSFALLWVLGQAMHAPWFYAGLGVDAPSTGMALVLFFMVLPAFTFLFQPVMSVYARRQEFEADEYAARNAHAADLVTALVKLYKDNASTLTPDPIHSAFYDSHPPAAVRISRLQHVA
jgi:STE24 endopeptidase